MKAGVVAAADAVAEIEQLEKKQAKEEEQRKISEKQIFVFLL